MSLQSPLEKLLFDRDDIDLNVIAEALDGRVGIDKKSGSVSILSGLSGETISRQLVAYVLGRKASFLLGVSETEAVSPKQMSLDTGITGGSVRPNLSTLVDKRILTKDDDGGYFIAAHQVRDAVRLLEEGR